jgi:hypothetical protein
MYHMSACVAQSSRRDSYGLMLMLMTMTSYWRDIYSQRYKYLYNYRLMWSDGAGGLFKHDEELNFR